MQRTDRRKTTHFGRKLCTMWSDGILRSFNLGIRRAKRRPGKTNSRLITDKAPPWNITPRGAQAFSLAIKHCFQCSFAGPAEHMCKGPVFPCSKKPFPWFIIYLETIHVTLNTKAHKGQSANRCNHWLIVWIPLLSCSCLLSRGCNGGERRSFLCTEIIHCRDSFKGAQRIHRGSRT